MPEPYGHAMAFDDGGPLLADFRDPGGAYPQTTGLTETSESHYFQSLHDTVLGWMPKRRVGLD